jgi:hypothetical protein
MKQMKYISLDERPEKKVVKFFMVVFGVLCIFTAGWWTLFLVKNPENEKVFWLATLFLFAFGIYQVYAGFGKAARYIITDRDLLTIKQNSFLGPVKFKANDINRVIIERGQITLSTRDEKLFHLKLGIKYPDLGESIKSEIVSFAEEYNIGIEYKYD